MRPEPAQNTVIRSCQLGIAAKQNKGQKVNTHDLLNCNCNIDQEPEIAQNTVIKSAGHGSQIK